MPGYVGPSIFPIPGRNNSLTNTGVSSCTTAQDDNAPTVAIAGTCISQ
jgi:hypothetical protein